MTFDPLERVQNYFLVGTLQYILILLAIFQFVGAFELSFQVNRFPRRVRTQPNNSPRGNDSGEYTYENEMELSKSHFLGICLQLIFGGFSELLICAIVHPV